MDKMLGVAREKKGRMQKSKEEMVIKGEEEKPGHQSVVLLDPDVGHDEAEQGHNKEPHRGHHWKRENIGAVDLRNSSLTDDKSFKHGYW